MHELQTLYTIRTFNSLRFSVLLEIFERMVDFVFEGPSYLRIYALMAVRGITLKKQYLNAYNFTFLLGKDTLNSLF